MQKTLTRFSMALAIAVLMSPLAVFAQSQGKRPADPPPDNPSFACGILTDLGAPQVVLDALGCGE